eukprot:6315086-Amphidinium_carterae.1
MSETYTTCRATPTEQTLPRTPVQLICSQPAEATQSGISLIVNEKTGTVHDPICFALDIHPSSWATRCGWLFGPLQYKVPTESTLPATTPRCRRCFPHVHLTLSSPPAC